MNTYFWESNKIRLRPCQESDIEAYLEAEQESEAIRCFEDRIRPPQSAANIREWIEDESAEDASQYLTLTVLSRSGDIVGTANIRNWNNQQGTFELGVRIFGPYQRKGYASDVIRILLRYGFGELRCQKANSATIDGNVASIKLHHQLGFKDEGRIRRNCFTNGQYHDELRFGITKEEFLEREQNRQS